MKNIEKYKETKDALGAFREWCKDHTHSVLTMSVWLDREYEAPPRPTLLEAAESVKKVWDSQWQYGSLSRVAKAISHLADAIDREKPVLNCDKYRTAEEAFDAFDKMCSTRCCEDCEFDKPRKNQRISCRFGWLYAEAGKGEAK